MTKYELVKTEIQQHLSMNVNYIGTNTFFFYKSVNYPTDNIEYFNLHTGVPYSVYFNNLQHHCFFIRFRDTF